MTDGEFANEIPDFLGEFGNSGLKDQAAATGTEDFTGVVSNCQIFIRSQLHLYKCYINLKNKHFIRIYQDL